MTIPTLANLPVYQNNYYSLMRIFPEFQECATVIEYFLKKIIEAGDIYIRVYPKTIPLILKDGCLKNAVETGTSATNGGSEARITSTVCLFNCDKNKLADADYPTFGYLSCKDSFVNEIATYDMSFQYGDAAIKLKKDHLFNRTTLTVGSSIDFMSCAHMIPTLLTDPKATCIYGPANPKGILSGSSNAILGLDPIRHYRLLAHAIATEELTVENFYRLEELLGDRCPFFKYFELQFHGRVTVDDFEEISMMADLDKESQDKLAKLGIPLKQIKI